MSHVGRLFEDKSKLDGARLRPSRRVSVEEELLLRETDQLNAELNFKPTWFSPMCFACAALNTQACVALALKGQDFTWSLV